MKKIAFVLCLAITVFIMGCSGGEDSWSSQTGGNNETNSKENEQDNEAHREQRMLYANHGINMFKAHADWQVKDNPDKLNYESMVQRVQTKREEYYSMFANHPSYKYTVLELADIDKRLTQYTNEALADFYKHNPIIQLTDLSIVSGGTYTSNTGSGILYWRQRITFNSNGSCSYVLLSVSNGSSSEAGSGTGTYTISKNHNTGETTIRVVLSNFSTPAVQSGIFSLRIINQTTLSGNGLLAGTASNWNR